MIRDLCRRRDGATAVEYAMILAFVFLAMIGGAHALGSELQAIFGLVASEMTTAIDQSIADATAL